MYTIKQIPEDFYVKEIISFEFSKDGDYSIFILKKRGYTTVRALQHITSALKMPLKSAGFAGTKDKNAVTEQAISLKGIGKEKAERLNLKDLSLEFLGKSAKPLSLGDLEGNYFRIIVKDAGCEPKRLEKFRNYFGEQRFSKNNAEAGKAIIKKDFKRAAELICQSSGDQEKLVKMHLDKFSKDYVGALRKIPLKILKMYVHAYQSMLWNKIAEKSDECELQIIGFGASGLSQSEIEIMKSEGITSRDFIIREMPELSSEGGKRNVFAAPKKLKITKKSEGCYELEFELPKGSYATELIRQMFSC